MLRTIDTGRAGIIAQQTRLDTVANNLANVNTPAFKRQEVSFADLLYQEMNAAGRPVEKENPAGADPVHGTGARAAAVTKNFSGGALITTGRPLDLAIAGEGFLQVELPDGRYAYTRSGALNIAPDGTLVVDRGYPLAPGITLPGNYREITISFDGTVLVGGEDGAPEEAGRLSLYRFVNPAGLDALGNNLYVPTPASGEPVEGTPGQGGFGVFRPGCLESSNVDLTREMVSLVETQRAAQIALRMVQNAEEMWNIANNLRK
ncbi:MAG: flagellar basal-body rod protein FlgG [Armatimonadetes bacterium]|nr:flagellar basal-body rod protein FlgG [Armatimonadota bacterium]